MREASAIPAILESPPADITCRVKGLGSNEGILRQIKESALLLRFFGIAGTRLLESAARKNPMSFPLCHPNKSNCADTLMVLMSATLDNSGKCSLNF